MKFNIKIMDKLTAEEISRWQYEQPYSIYSMDGCEDTINEFLNAPYYSVFQNNKLTGYFCFGESAQVPIGNKISAYSDKNYTDIGLGLKPELCGKGHGYCFLKTGLNFAANTFSKNNFRLTVAQFNERAIKVYEKIGFNKTKVSFNKKNGENNIDFIIMILENWNNG